MQSPERSGVGCYLLDIMGFPPEEVASRALGLSDCKFRCQERNGKNAKT